MPAPLEIACVKSLLYKKKDDLLDPCCAFNAKLAVDLLIDLPAMTAIWLQCIAQGLRNLLHMSLCVVHQSTSFELDLDSEKRLVQNIVFHPSQQ